MVCDCGGILFVVKIHEEKDLSNNRLCDVQCGNCGKILYYQPYDFGSTINIVKGNDNSK